MMLWLGRLVAGMTAVVVGAASVGSGYLGILTAAAVWRRSPTSRRSTTRRFAILVPAHDESAVIGRALAGFERLEYPTDRFEVHVVADNCTDDTAGIVRGSRFEVHERTDADHPGKGAALNWLVDLLEAECEPPDAYVVVDADTVVDPSFLTAMDRALALGALAAQGYYSVLDPGSSTTSGLRYAALACRHHTRPLGRTNLGASAGLYGNGMVFRRELLADRRWTGHLVEDAEFQMELLLDGILVAYVPDARLEAEMPHTLDGSTSQNQRWERGRLQLTRRYVPTLVHRSLQRGVRHRIAHVDAALDHLVPPLSVLVAADGAAVLVAAAMRVARGSRLDRWTLRVATVSTVTIVLHVLTSLYLVRAPRAVYRSLIGTPRAVLWKLGLWSRMIFARQDVAWVRTERNAEPADRA